MITLVVSECIVPAYTAELAYIFKQLLSSVPNLDLCAGEEGLHNTHFQDLFSYSVQYIPLDKWNKKYLNYAPWKILFIKLREKGG